MRSIEARFLNEQKRNPYLGSLIHFTRAVKGQGFTRETIGRWFYKLVEPGDYPPREARSILNHLYDFSKPEDDSKKEKFALQGRLNLEAEGDSDSRDFYPPTAVYGAVRGV